MHGGVNEKAVLLGPRRSLVGILTQPARSTRSDGAAIVILNTGIIHRVGHHRMYVTMSRAMAKAGYTVLRFDFSGIGDSEQRRDGLSPFDGCLADVEEALDWMEVNCRASRFVLVGMCSGADHAVFYGGADRRVAALALIDPSIPRTARYFLSYIRQHLVRTRSWINVMTGRSRTVNLWSKWLLRRALPARKADDFDLRSVEQAYRTSVDRGTKILAVFTGDLTRQAYRNQMIDAFPKVPFGKQLQLQFFPDSDHTFTSVENQSKLIQTIIEWLKTALS